MKRIALALAVVLVGVALWAFEPWRLFTSSTVDEPLPTAESTAEGRETPSVADGQTLTPAPPQVLATGTFEDAEHGTDGSVKVLHLEADGRRFVRFEDLATSDGPDLHVWVTDQPSGGEWGSYDDGRYVKLGELKATHGNQNYEIPADVDLTGMRSVVIWCDRFNVAFGTAAVAL